MPKVSIREYLSLRAAGYTNAEISAYRDEPDELPPDPAPAGDPPEKDPPAPAAEAPTSADPADIRSMVAEVVADALAQIHLDNVSGGQPGTPPQAADPEQALVDIFNAKG